MTTPDRHASWSPQRWLALCVVTVLGVATLVGSGGGIGFPPYAPPDLGSYKPPPLANIDPVRATVQVGTRVRFTALVANASQPTFRWCRIARGANACIDLPGATGDIYTLDGANLADDGAIYRVDVSDPNGSTFAIAGLWVSPMPGVTFQDSEFALSGWSVASVADPAQGGPTVAVSQAPSGGNPGAYRSVAITVPAVPGSIRVYHANQSALYDPAVQGAIYLVDFGEDCVTADVSSTNAVIWTVPLLEQAGRRYIAVDSWRRNCSSGDWVSGVLRTGLAAQDFVQVDGPACGAGAACPDFGAQGAPVRLGFANLLDASSAATPGTKTRGIDNWKATVWRR